MAKAQIRHADVRSIIDYLCIEIFYNIHLFCKELKVWSDYVNAQTDLGFRWHIRHKVFFFLFLFFSALCSFYYCPFDISRKVFVWHIISNKTILF